MVKKDTHIATEMFGKKFGKEVDNLGIYLFRVIQEYEADQSRKVRSERAKAALKMKRVK